MEVNKIHKRGQKKRDNRLREEPVYYERQVEIKLDPDCVFLFLLTIGSLFVIGIRFPIERMDHVYYGISGFTLGCLQLFFGKMLLNCLNSVITPERRQKFLQFFGIMLITAFTFYLATQLGQYSLKNGLSHGEKNAYYTIAGILFGVSMLLTGLATSVAIKNKNIRPRLPTKTYINTMLLILLIGGTSFMFLIWFMITDGDDTLLSNLERGRTCGFVAIGKLGIFFSSKLELIFMLSSSITPLIYAAHLGEAENLKI